VNIRLKPNLSTQIILISLVLLFCPWTAVAQSSCQACLVVLDPHASHAFTAGNGAHVNLANCGIRVNSDNGAALYGTGAAVVTSASNQVVGGYSAVNGASFTPTPQTGAPAANDPYASLQAPSIGSCTSHPDYTQWGQNGHYEIYPGTYCGGLAVSNGVTAHFNPGTYVISGGGIQFGSGSVSGTGVTFYITGTSFTNNQLVAINNGMTVSLAAPTSGTYQGVLFFQDRSINNTALSSSFAGRANMTLTGSLYFPTTALAFNNGSSSTANVALLARTVDFEGGAGIQLNPSSAQVLPPVSVSVSPGAANVYGSQTRQFSATVVNGCTSNVTWSISPASGAGTISTGGLYTAPATVSTQQTVTVTATSQADGSKTGTATLTLLPPVSVAVVPATATLYGGQTQQLTATVANDPSNAGVVWTLSPAAGAGTINAAGLYTAPASIGSTQTVTVTATSVTDATKSAAATVTLRPPVTVSVAPTSANLYGGQAKQFSATVTNTDPNNAGVTWTVSPATGAGTVSSSGLYTAPGTVAALQTVTVTATSVADTTKSASAVVTLLPPISVSVSPATANLYGGQTKQFSATVSNDPTNAGVTWSITPTTGAGTLSATGLYTAPASITAQQNVTVTATSIADGTKTGTATVTLLPPVGVSVSPTAANLYAGQTKQFTATVTSDPANAGVIWTLNPATGVGTISAAGLYTAPASISSTQTVTVTATSQTDGTKTASATVTLLPPASVNLNLTTATLYASQTKQFTATVANDPSNSGVMWSLSPATGAGTISTGGLYTAPATIAAQQTVAVTATAVADTTKSASAVITLLPPITVTVTPSAANLYGGQTKQFSATVANDPTNAGVAWTLIPATGAGTLTATGLYTAPTSVTSPQSITVTAKSLADNTTIGTATITLFPPISVTVAPTTVNLYGGQTKQFNASVANDPTNGGVTWSLTPANGAGTISTSGLYTAPASIAAQQTVTVTATSVADTSKSNTATITLLPPVVVTASPATANLYGGQTKQFSASVTNDPANSGVTWSLNPPTGGGTITAAGLYTAPATVSSSQTVGVIATSVADPTKSASATVSLLPPVTVTVVPTSANLYAAQPKQFDATVTNDPANAGVTWTLTPATGTGTISTSGLYTAPSSVSTQQTVTITATSQADNTKSSTATITLYPPISVSVSPATANLYSGQTKQFSASVANDPTNAGVTWTITPPTGAGTISAGGLYTAPPSVTSQQTVTVTAKSQADNTTTGTATITLLPPITVSLGPATVNIYGGQTKQFSATVVNDPTNAGVTWTITPATGAGTISATGLYAAPAIVGAQQTVTVTA